MSFIPIIEAYDAHGYIKKQDIGTAIKIPISHDCWAEDFRGRFISHEFNTNKYLLDRASRLRNTNVVDTGAHVGDTGLFLAKALKDMGRTDIKVIMIEPHPDKIRFIRSMIALNGLGRVARVIEGAVGKQQMCGRIIEENHPGAWRIAPTRAVEDCGVTIFRLDDIVADAGLLHLDVEGHELDALMGAIKLLRKDRPVLVLEKIHSDMDRIDSFLRSFGYTKDVDLPPYDVSYVPWHNA